MDHRHLSAGVEVEHERLDSAGGSHVLLEERTDVLVRSQ
jgi:hypothetical protein